MAGPDESQPPPSPTLETLADGLSSRVGNRVILVILLVAVAAGSAAFVSPSLFAEPPPALTQANLGQPYGGPLFKAPRDYEIVNHALTEQRRQEARGAIRPVYDFNPTVLEDLHESVHDAFSTLQEIVAASHQAQQQVQGSDDERAKKKRPPATEDPDLADALRDARFDFEEKLLGRSDAAIETDDFQALASARFSTELESALSALLDRAYTALITSSREDVLREGGQGIVVRDLRDLAEQVRLPVPPSVLDVREAQLELDRFSLNAGAFLPDKLPALRRAIVHLAKRMLRPNLTVNIAETDARRRRAAEDVKEAVITVRKGQRVIAPGEMINETHLAVLAGIRDQSHEHEAWQLELGAFGLVALLISITYGFFRSAFRRFRPTRKDALLLGVLLIGSLAALHLGVQIADAIHDRYERVPLEGLCYAIPLAGTVMLVRFLLAQELALWFALLLSALAGFSFGHSLSFGLYTLVVSLVGADRVTAAKDRAGIVKAGAIAGLAAFAVSSLFAMADGKLGSMETWTSASLGALGTLVFAPAVVMAVMPVIEIALGYASDLKLLELANLNHPALKELIVQAPGTYHHSIILGTLAENAAEAIGANSLLARTCAYYHDIGKGRNPLYFSENQKGDNRHDALAPAMSAVIIKRHVTEGLEMARQYRLPKQVADAIPQHHGTRLVGYFFHKAVKEQEGKEHPQPVDEETYRYPGPKPQFREAALVMIADAVEASCRSIADPTSARLQQQVQKIINLIFSEGQLDECELTLKDLNLIAQSFLHTLEGIYHARPEYPPGALGKPSDAKLMVASPDNKRSAGG